MPSDCGRIPTSSIFITTYSDNDHFIVTSQRNYAPPSGLGREFIFRIIGIFMLPRRSLGIAVFIKSGGLDRGGP